MKPKDMSPSARIAPANLLRPNRVIRDVGLLLILGCFLSVSSTRAAVAPRSESLTRFTYSEYLMGVDARIVVYAKDKTNAEQACSAAFERIAALDAMMSDYRVDSELNKLCAKAGGPPVHVSPDLFIVLKQAQEIARKTSGDFDVTVGPLVRLWRKARKTTVHPSSAEIRENLRLVGWKKMRLNARNQTVKLLVPGMKLDLGGIAKGYADDQAQIVLKRHGITRALVEMGGDIVVTDPPPGTKGWEILVPNAGNKKGPVAMRFADKAISTSGDTAQFVVIGGIRYSHVVDPHSGMATTTRVQATAIARDGLTSDPLSTALTLVSPRARTRLLKGYPGTKCYVRVLANVE